MSAILQQQDHPEYIQGSSEWHALRKTKITATDAAVIIGLNPWKTPYQLYHEKKSNEPPPPANAAMQRGTELEPIAREKFILSTGIRMIPRVVIKDWAMASLDGISDENEILEIKCSGDKVHAEALQGKVPSYYYPQLQHQMYVCDALKAYYFSFDGNDGISIEVQRDDEFIKTMIDAEYAFYQRLETNTPPQSTENDYIERNDDTWIEQVTKWKSLTASIKDLETQEEELRKRLIFLSGESNTRGGGISLCQVTRKGNVDYTKIPELKKIDLEQYRKPSTMSWRITVI